MNALIRGLAAAVVLGVQPGWGWWSRGGEAVKALQAQYDAGRYEAVIRDIEAGVLQRLSGASLRRGYTLLGASYEKAGHLDKAMSAYQVGVQLFPRDEELLTRLARLMHDSGLDEQAQPLYERALRGNPDSAYAHLGLAQIDRSLGFLDRSAEHFEKALEDLPQAAYWLEYAEVLADARDYATAELAARRSLTIEPSDAARLELALILRAMGRIDEALAQIEPLAKAGLEGALRALALWRMEAGRDGEALAAAADLLRRDAQDTVGLYVRARIHLRAGRRTQAVEDLRQAALGRKEAPFAAEACARLADLFQRRP